MKKEEQLNKHMQQAWEQQQGREGTAMRIQERRDAVTNAIHINAMANIDLIRQQHNADIKKQLWTRLDPTDWTQPQRVP